MFGWTTQLRTNMKAVSGIRRAYKHDEVPHSLGTNIPAAIIMPISGDQEYSEGGQTIAIHRVQITVYVTTQILPKSLGKAVNLIPKVRDKLAGDIQLGGNCVHCLPDEPFYEGPGVITYADREYMGVVFNVIVKENETGSVTVSR